MSITRTVLATTTAASFGLFLLLWVVAALAVGRGPFYIDPQDALENPKLRIPRNRAGRTFESSLDRYLHVSKTIIGLAVGSIALLSGYISYLRQSESDALADIQRAFAVPALLLAFSVLSLVLFMAFLTWRYETYLQDMEAHTRFWYSLNMALGFSGLIYFAMGYLWLPYSLLLLKPY